MTGSGPELAGAAAGARGADREAAPLTYDALVLAGGRARRLGGVSKPDVVVSGRRLLAHVLDAAEAGPGGGARRIVVVAPGSVAVPGGVLRTLEDPPDGGPVAGIAAGLAALGREDAAVRDAAPYGRDAAGPDGPAGLGGGAVPGAPEPGDGPAPWVLVLACDIPRAAVAVPHLVAACSGAGAASGALLVDADGRDQPLVGLYRRTELDRALTVLAAGRDDGTVRGAPVRALLAPLTLVRVPDDASAAADLDTWEDVRAFDAARPPDVDVVARPGARPTPPRWDDGEGPPDPAVRPGG
ncbi:NTP transferase domain-containing protein [Cellulomonas cellasea]|uniref:Molybdopterin-guanine dinucleotide biosynthesis protein A n=1 Tax=Cellulomonas cellasea TaxID=43670 RepID=A0A7W4UET1_9CELL|nr:NTP transferase domain-containing protein [Cellulomonas cellasea]MBB2922821.1 molybdopterin-guanine dinucleotide biosynthesis protein A [Cellulomonas cellasea]